METKYITKYRLNCGLLIYVTSDTHLAQCYRPNQGDFVTVQQHIKRSYTKYIYRIYTCNDILNGISWYSSMVYFCTNLTSRPASSWFLGWVGLWGFLWWAPLAKRKDHHGVSSGWSSAWFHSNTGLSSTKYEQIPIIFGVWPFWQTPFFFWSITFWQVYD